MRDLEWNKKINRAAKVEKEILKWLKKEVDKTATKPIFGSKYYDIMMDSGDVEVKEDRFAHKTGNYAVEYIDASNEPSGIGITTARYFVIVDWNYVIFTETDNLKFIIENCVSKKTVSMGYTTQEGKRARGWLIPCDVVLHSPLVNVVNRWFPNNL